MTNFKNKFLCEFHWTAISASGATIPSGIYFFTIESNGIVQSKKLIFMK